MHVLQYFRAALLALFVGQLLVLPESGISEVQCQAYIDLSLTASQDRLVPMQARFSDQLLQVPLASEVDALLRTLVGQQIDTDIGQFVVIAFDHGDNFGAPFTERIVLRLEKVGTQPSSSSDAAQRLCGIAGIQRVSMPHLPTIRLVDQDGHGPLVKRGHVPFFVAPAIVRVEAEPLPTAALSVSPHLSIQRLDTGTPPSSVQTGVPLPLDPGHYAIISESTDAAGNSHRSEQHFKIRTRSFAPLHSTLTGYAVTDESDGSRWLEGEIRVSARSGRAIQISERSLGIFADSEKGDEVAAQRYAPGESAPDGSIAEVVSDGSSLRISFRLRANHDELPAFFSLLGFGRESGALLDIEEVVELNGAEGRVESPPYASTGTIDLISFSSLPSGADPTGEDPQFVAGCGWHPQPVPGSGFISPRVPPCNLFGPTLSSPPIIGNWQYRDGYFRGGTDVDVDPRAIAGQGRLYMEGPALLSSLSWNNLPYLCSSSQWAKERVRVALHPIDCCPRCKIDHDMSSVGFVKTSASGTALAGSLGELWVKPSCSPALVKKETCQTVTKSGLRLISGNIQVPPRLTIPIPIPLPSIGISHPCENSLDGFDDCSHDQCETEILFYGKASVDVWGKVGTSLRYFPSISDANADVSGFTRTVVTPKGFYPPGQAPDGPDICNRAIGNGEPIYFVGSAHAIRLPGDNFPELPAFPPPPLTVTPESEP